MSSLPSPPTTQPGPSLLSVLCNWRHFRKKKNEKGCGPSSYFSLFSGLGLLPHLSRAQQSHYRLTELLRLEDPLEMV